MSLSTTLIVETLASSCAPIPWKSVQQEHERAIAGLGDVYGQRAGLQLSVRDRGNALRHRPELNSASELLTPAFQQAPGQLRPVVTTDAEVMGLLGMLLELAAWRSRHWTDLTDQQVTGLVTARLRPLLHTHRALIKTRARQCA